MLILLSGTWHLFARQHGNIHSKENGQSVEKAAKMDVYLAGPVISFVTGQGRKYPLTLGDASDCIFYLNTVT